MINEDLIIVIEQIHHIDRKEKLLCGGKLPAIIVLRHNDLFLLHIISMMLKH